MIVVQYHCDDCGRFVRKEQTRIIKDKFTNRKRMICSECYGWAKPLITA
jgi:hypothetical protein